MTTATVRRRPAPAPEPPADGTAAEERPPAGRDPVAWVSWLFVLNFCLQRLSLPGISIPLTVPITVLWLWLAWRKGVVAIEPRRTFLWLAGAGAAALVVLPQLAFVKAPYVSVNSWAFWMVIWLPAVFMMADRSRATYDRCLRAVTNIGLGLAAISLLFTLTQLAGIPYRDYVADVVPQNLLVQDFNTSYPLSYGGSLYKSNGWLALEPSFMSFTLGLCILAALLSGARTWKVAVLVLGMVATVAGSGFFLVLVGAVTMVLRGQWRLLRKYVPPALLLAVLVAPTTFGQTIVARLGEGGDNRSSTALRTFEPYRYLWPRWVQDWPQVFVGGGAGSSRMLVDGSGVNGLLVPTIGKMMFDYGLIVGSLLFALVIACYLRAPEPAIGMAVLVSMCVLQPPAQPLMIPAFLLVTLWAPTSLGNRSAGTVAAGPPGRPTGRTP